MLLSTILLLVTKKLKTTLAKNKKKALPYILFVVLTFGLAGFLGYDKVLNAVPLHSFIAIQIVFFILGIVHVIVIHHFFPEMKDTKNLATEILFTLALLFIGLTVFSNVIGRFKPNYTFIFLGTGLAWLIPFLFYKCYLFALTIPLPIFKTWSYPLDNSILEPTNDELKSPVVIHLKFKKNEHEDIINFTIKAPRYMEFSRLFYIFINDYNERHPEDTIQYVNEGKVDQWSFYFQPKWYQSFKHVDYSKTIIDNNIKENDTIICERV